MRLDASTAEVVQFLQIQGYRVHFPVDAEITDEQARVALDGNRHAIVTRTETLGFRVEVHTLDNGAKLGTPTTREIALREAHDEIESTKVLANTTGIRWIVFFSPRYGWMRTDTPSPRWLPIDSTIAVVYPHPELHDKKRELAWEQSHPVSPYLPHCTEIVAEHKWVMDVENGGIKPSA